MIRREHHAIHYPDLKTLLRAVKAIGAHNVGEGGRSGMMGRAAWQHVEAAYERFRHPAMAMSIQADAALDVGDTLVGMHIRPVAVPLRMPEAKIGQAHVVMAYARYPLIGGARAQYPEAIR